MAGFEPADFQGGSLSRLPVSPHPQKLRAAGGFSNPRHPINKSGALPVLATAAVFSRKVFVPAKVKAPYGNPLSHSPLSSVGSVSAL